MIRVAQLGWELSNQADTIDDVKAGVGCYWVEIDGVRIDRVIRVEWVAANDEVTIPRLVVDVAGGMEIVYVDSDGEPLPGPSVPVASLPEIEHGVVLPRQELDVG